MTLEEWNNLQPKDVIYIDNPNAELLKNTIDSKFYYLGARLIIIKEIEQFYTDDNRYLAKLQDYPSKSFSIGNYPDYEIYKCINRFNKIEDTI